jgi:four helix bundle protein
MSGGKGKMEKGKGAVAPRLARLRDFTELEVWQVARKLRAEIYRLTATFPPEEKYGLTSQMRRAAISITANLAEGYGRFSYQENIQFCRQSRASVDELRDHLTTALDAGHFSREVYEATENLAMQAIRLVNGYIRRTKALKAEAQRGMHASG